jgi:putative ABC transport system permease protein
MTTPTISNTPLLRLAWRRMQKRPLQYVLLIVGVAIGVAMMVSIDLANSSARRAFQLSTDAVTGRTTHRIVGGPTGLDSELYVRLRTELGYSPAAPVVEGYVQIREIGQQPLRLVGIDPFAEPPFRPYFGDGSQGLEGLTAFMTRPNGLIIAADVAADQGLDLGDVLMLDLGGRLFDAPLVGLLQPDDESSRRALSGLIFTDIASAQEVLGMNGRLSHIGLIAHSNANLVPIEAILPAGVVIEPAAARGNAIQQMTAAFELNLTALSLLALVVGMFLIYNTVTFSVLQRRQQFGILRCLGATSCQLFLLILAEALVLGLIGAILGLALGVLLGRGTVGLITQTINDFYFVVNVRDVAIPPETLLRGLIFGVGAAVVASLVPAWEAMRTTPASTLRRSSLESRTLQLLPWLVLTWLLLSGAGILLLWLPQAGLVAAFAGLFAILIAAALLTAPVTVVLMRLSVPLGERLIGVLGRMAPRDIVRSLSRTSVAIAALMTAVSVVVGVSIMIGSFRGTVVDWLDQTLRADIFISPPTVTANRTLGTIQPELVAELQQWPGAADIFSAHSVDVRAPDLERPLQMVIVDGDVSRGNRRYAWTASADPFAALEAGQGVMVSEALLLRENLSLPPDPLRLETPAGPQTFPIVAVHYDYASDQGTVLVDRGLYEQVWGETAVSSLAIFLEPGQSVDEVVGALQTAVAGRQELLIQSNQGLRQNSLEVFDRTFAITSALRLLAVLVAFIGVLSALMSLQLERARELGVLRANGMTVRQLWSLTIIETGLMGFVAGLLAMPVGYVLAWILIYVINVRSFGWTLQMELQPAYFWHALLVAVGAALLAGIYPSLRLGRMVIATAIRQE